MVGYLLIAVVVTLVVGAVTRGMRRGPAGGRASPGVRAADGSAIRRFFTYVLLFVALFVAGTGVAGLVDRALGLTGPDAGPELLAQQVAFTVIGVPLLVALVLWTRARLRADPDEARSRGWSLYLTAGSILSLVLTLTALQTSLAWVFGLVEAPEPQLGELLVWAPLWLLHREVERRVGAGSVIGAVETPATPGEPRPSGGAQARERLTPAGFAGAVVGLGLTAAGAVVLVGAGLGVLLHLRDLAVGDTATLARTGVVMLLTGLVPWVVCWLLPLQGFARGTLWHVHVLLAGVAGGLLTAVVGASIAVERVGVWLLGEPAGATAQEFFGGVPFALGAVLVGALVWAHHRAVLGPSDAGPRTEVDRAHDYLLAAVGLFAAAAGVVQLVVSGIEALAGSTGSAALAPGESPVNTVIAAATFLLVGAPLWWWRWTLVQRVTAREPEAERRSRVRRAYVLLLFGIVGLVGLGVLLGAAITVLQDAFGAGVDADTLLAVRYELGVLVTAAIVAGYHWRVYLADREARVEQWHGPRYVLLVGPADPTVTEAVHQRTGGTVSLLARTDASGPPWPVDELNATLAGLSDPAVVVVADADGLHTIPVAPR